MVRDFSDQTMNPVAPRWLRGRDLIEKQYDPE